MRYVTPRGLVVTDRRHTRSDVPPIGGDPRSWPPNDNVNPPPPNQPGVGPNMSEGFGNDHVMYPDPAQQVVYTGPILPPPVMPWSGWPTEWATPSWNTSMGGLAELVNRVSVVFGCIDLNASLLSTMPPYRLAGEDMLPPLPWMANPQPEVYVGWTEAMKQVVISYFCGEAFLWATSRYSDGTVRNWVMLNPGWVDVEMEGQMRRYEMAGLDITSDVLHIRYTSWPGVPRGVGPLEAMAQNLFGVEAMERYQSSLSVRGGIPWGVLTAPGNLNQDQANEQRQRFVEARLSAMGAPAVLSGGITLTPFTITPKDMALLELRQFDEARIATLLSVPPMLMALPSGDSSMTYRNAEGIYDFHWRAYLRPKAATISEAISHWALPSTQSIELNRDEYVKPNPAQRAVMYQTLFNIFDPATGQRAITVDEIRAAERFEAIDPVEQPTTDPSAPAPGAPAPPAPPPNPSTSLSTATGQGQVTGGGL